MFSFGDDDKDKLKENMEQIKQMINEGESIDEGAPPNQEPAPQTQSPEPDVPEDDIQPESEPMEPEPRQENLLDQEEAGFQEPVQDQTDTGLQQQGVEEQAPRNESRPDTRNEPAQPSREQRRNTGRTDQSGNMRSDQNRETRTQNSVRNLNDEIPSPPENKEVDVPEIEKGPLFIRQRKFRKAREMLQEMMYLSGEVEKTVNSLEAGIQEDHKTEKRIREMIHEFEADRSEVENIVSPEE